MAAGLADGDRGHQLRPVRVVGATAQSEELATFFMSGRYTGYTDYATTIHTVGTAPLQHATVRASAGSGRPRAGLVAVRVRDGQGGPGLGGRAVVLQLQEGRHWQTLRVRRTDGSGLASFPAAPRRRATLRVLVGTAVPRTAMPVAVLSL